MNMKNFLDEFAISENEGKNKIVPLKDAISNFIQPNMTVHFGVTHTVPYGVIYEIVRQFAGKNTKFKVVMLASFGQIQMLAAAKLVEKLITSYAGDAYPRPSPSPVFQRAMKDGMKIENWSTLSIPLMLMAGALNFEYMPLNSVVGSSMEKENKDSFITAEVGGKKMTFVKGIKPDISITHAWFADQNGNALVVPPVSEGFYGQHASKNGVVITAEKIVSTAFIREHAHYPIIPGHIVNAVVEVPFGAHPGGHIGIGEGYAEDLAFMIDFRKAGKSADSFEKWMKEWIFDVGSHEGYLQKLGNERLASLRGRFNPEAWRLELGDKEKRISHGAEYTPEEMMICVATRILMKKIKDNEYRVLLAGQGASNLSAWLANMRLKSEGVSIELFAENGFYGYMPRPASPFIFNMANSPTCKLLCGSMETLGLIAMRSSIAVLGAAQIDINGNINSTKIGDFFIVGSGGANDATSNASEIIVLVPQDKGRLIKKVPYVTGCGSKVTTLVTTSGVFEKERVDPRGGSQPHREANGEFYLTAVFSGHSVEEIKKSTGWEVRVAEKVGEEKPPEHRDLMVLRYYDLDGYFIR
jgi:acyl CoA:acetate/3-ketoacid CoA transferase alpha subunit/acyl CoA:acetate/3-ketoacid CoA transferase beta subunit